MDLGLAERLLLLAIDGDRGTIDTRTSMALRFGLTGAMLHELAARRCISYRNDAIVARRSASAADPLLDAALAIIKESSKRHDVRTWVKKLAHGMPTLRNDLLARLVDGGILRREERRILWIFRAERYPTVDSAPRSELRTRLRRVLRRQARKDAPTMALITIAHACGLIDVVLAKEERHGVEGTIRQLTANEPLARAVAAAVTRLAAAGRHAAATPAMSGV